MTPQQAIAILQNPASTDDQKNEARDALRKAGFGNKAIIKFEDEPAAA